MPDMELKDRDAKIREGAILALEIIGTYVTKKWVSVITQVNTKCQESRVRERGGGTAQSCYRVRKKCQH